jgi:predicted GIY-YIG superfamily endonuclease
MYKIYWIKYSHYSDPKTEGYIGLTSQNIEDRLKEHKYNNKNKLLKNRCKKENVEIVCLHENLSKEEAKLLEEKYRPSENIGWNINKGGDMPPSRIGKQSPKSLLRGDFRTEKQKEASKRRSEKIKGNNFSGQRKNKIIHKMNCECCGVEFTFKDISKPRKYCSIKCAVKKRNENIEYKKIISKKAKERWQNSEFKMRVSESIRKSLNDGSSS